VLLGRTRELDAIDGFLGDVRAGRGRGLLVTGEAGIGKTALLDAARERAAGEFRVITTVGIEAEADLPFASLVEIANPLLGHLDDLPAPQAGAIRAALVLAEHPAPVRSRLAACAGLLGLLRSAAREEPLLVLIDDAQWLDASSRECVGYAARRLDGARVGMLAAARTGPGTTTLDGRFADELPLHGLGPDHAKQLLRTTAGELAPTAVESMLDAAAGNPLALIELPALLSDQQRRGLAPFAPAPVPGGDLWEAFAHRVAALGPQARQAVLVASASYDRALAPVVGACRELGVAVSALEHAEEAGVLTLHDDQVNFTHPLLRGVAYGQGTEAERRRAHAALARHAEPDAGAWHQAAAALGPSAEVSAALEAAGRRATTRGAHTSAADAFERAAQLSDDADARAVRLLSAGLAAALGGDYERATVLLESIATVEQPRLRAAVAHLLALVTLSGGIRDALSNHASLTGEAERIARLDGAAAAELHADAAVIATVAGDCALALESAERAMAVLPADAAAPVRRHALAMLGMGLALRGRTAEGRAALDRAARLLPEVDPLSPAAQSIAFGMHAQICVGRARLLRDEVLALESATREAGGYGLMPYYLLLAADAGYRIGDWPAAERDIDEAVASAEHSSQRGPLSLALVVRARLHAVRGRTAAARADIEAGVAAAEPAGYGSTVLWAQAASGFLALDLGDAEEAIQELETVKQLAELASMEDPLIVPWAPDLVEAYCRAGRQEDARRIAALLDTQAQRSGVALARALAARCDGLVAEEEIDAPFQRACELHADADAPFEAARTLLAWGQRLHRARRRIEARERLREAHAAFERLGAEPWVQGALAELHAAGGRRTRAVDRDELTAQELRVALAVARGATNREVAAELFLSPKTIEFHLRLIYRKLGVRSRTQLARLVADGGLEEVAEAPAARV
jgi:DNA-binding CsgD family transcriptional regulator